MPAPAIKPRVDVWGLGPADAALIPSGLLHAVAATPTIVRTMRHPAADALPAGVIACDDLYEAASSIAKVYAAVVDRVVQAARRHGAAVYVVPGSPLIAEHTVELLRARADVEVRVHPSLSFLDLAWDRLGVDPFATGARLVNGHEFARGEGGPTLIAQCDSVHVLSDIKLSLDDGPDVVVLQRLGLPDESVTTVAWDDLDRVVKPDHLTSVWAVLPRDELSLFIDLVATLREMCPWDAAQTHETLTRFMLEEAYEAVEAIASGDADAIEGELGDVLFQVVLHATIAQEAGDFTLADVTRTVREKLIRRHRHVFGDVVADTPEQVEAMWARVKAEERGDRGDDPFAGVDAAQPALMHAAQIGRRAVAVDFDWPDVNGPLAKLAEEIGEVAEALHDHGAGSREVADEIGDLLFCAVHVARHAGVADPESALRAASAKFLRRFAAMKQLADARSIATSEELWQEAKRTTER
ncbi:MAG TPA: nucleoside triphosphate pyrophosphohydrolase [Acidimicrobiales bacterium]|nr:nucleoside triphosphate pyrophosphohydrolase [Acidimicrobiales bacterium]